MTNSSDDDKSECNLYSCYNDIYYNHTKRIRAIDLTCNGSITYRQVEGVGIPFVKKLFELMGWDEKTDRFSFRFNTGSDDDYQSYTSGPTFEPIDVDEMSLYKPGVKNEYVLVTNEEPEWWIHPNKHLFEQLFSGLSHGISIFEDWKKMCTREFVQSRGFRPLHCLGGLENGVNYIYYGGPGFEDGNKNFSGSIFVISEENFNQKSRELDLKQPYENIYFTTECGIDIHQMDYKEAKVNAIFPWTAFKFIDPKKEAKFKHDRKQIKKLILNNNDPPQSLCRRHSKKK